MEFGLLQLCQSLISHFSWPYELHIKVFVIPRATRHTSYHVDRQKRNMEVFQSKEVTVVSQGLLTLLCWRMRCGWIAPDIKCKCLAYSQGNGKFGYQESLLAHFSHSWVTQFPFACTPPSLSDVVALTHNWAAWAATVTGYSPLT